MDIEDMDMEDMDIEEMDIVDMDGTMEHLSWVFGKAASSTLISALSTLRQAMVAP